MTPNDVSPSSRPGGEPQSFTRAELTALEKCVLLIDPRSLMVDHGAAQSALAKIRALLPPETP